MPDLKRCPFCGGDASITVDKNEQTVYCSCWVCGARSMPIRYECWLTDETIEESLKYWEMRF